MKEFTQADFNTILFGIRQQGGPSFSRKTGECRYLIGNRKCAAGWLIPTEEYDFIMEGKAVTGVRFFQDCYTIPAIYAIHELQGIHDSAAKLTNNDEQFFLWWESDMRKFATNNGLVYTPPQT